MEHQRFVLDSMLERWAEYLSCRLEREYADAEAMNEIGDMSYISNLLERRDALGPTMFIDQAVTFLSKFEEM